MRCFWIFFHDWSLWEDIIINKTIYPYMSEALKYTEEIAGQKRYCKKCGKQEMRKV